MTRPGASVRPTLRVDRPVVPPATRRRDRRRKASPDEPVFAVANGWGSFVVAERSPLDDPLMPAGRPGLWKPGRTPGTTVFDVPPSIMARAEEPVAGDRDRPGIVLERVRTWALATRDGAPVEDWRAPDADDAAAWLPEQALTLHVRSIALQGRLTCEGDRLALGFDIGDPVPDDLPVARRAWLDEVLRDAQRRWRLVRLARGESGALVAEVDLSGAPEELLAELIAVAVDALRIVVAWLAEPVAFLVGETAGEILNRQPARASLG